MNYPNPCNQCGVCCLLEPCPVARTIYGLGKRDACPVLRFDGDVAICGMVEQLGPETMGIGQGCCIKATVYAKGNAMDVASLPNEMKNLLASQLRSSKIHVAHK